MKEIPFKKIESICFDLDDTLLRSTYADNIAIKHSISVLKEDPNIKLREKELEYRIQSIKKNRDHPHPTKEDYDTLLAELGMEEVDKLSVKALLSYQDVARVTWRLYPDVIPFLSAILKKEIVPLIISNGETTFQHEKLIRTGIVDFFPTITISDKFGVKKPDPRIYKGALDGIGVEANKAIFIGDRLDKDVVGAKKAGMFTVRIRRKDGKYYNDKPRNKDDTPDLTIFSLNEILDRIKLKI